MATYDHDTLEKVFTIPTFEVYSTENLDFHTKLSNSLFTNIISGIVSVFTGIVGRLIGLSSFGLFSICCLVPALLYS